MKVAIVHDYLTQYGGAERVLDEIKALYPQAPVLVSLYDPHAMPPAYRDWDVRASWLNKLPLAHRKHQALLPLYPHVFENLDLSEYDLVISSSSGFAHGVLTGPQTTHVCYCHSPPRFLWDFHRYVERERLGRLARTLVGARLSQLRQWDRTSADRADAWISTSRVVRDRIRKYYGKDSTIIAPPVNTRRFDVGDGSGGYYLMLMRLVGWKRPDIVVEACSKLGVELVVAGDGRELGHLRELAGPSVRFVGRVNDQQMRGLYRDCRALILPSEEDFGITPLEAMASGRPVIAYGRGGALDTIRPGVTGLFFDEQSVDAVLAALVSFEACHFNPLAIRAHAEQFDTVMFRHRMIRFIDAQVDARLAGQGFEEPYLGTVGLPALSTAAA
jgi:glycosyltransferase involved in cell wall biosynthesis